MEISETIGTGTIGVGTNAKICQNRSTSKTEPSHCDDQLLVAVVVFLTCTLVLSSATSGSTTTASTINNKKQFNHPTPTTQPPDLLPTNMTTAWPPPPCLKMAPCMVNHQQHNCCHDNVSLSIIIRMSNKSNVQKPHLHRKRTYIAQLKIKNGKRASSLPKNIVHSRMLVLCFVLLRINVRILAASATQCRMNCQTNNPKPFRNRRRCNRWTDRGEMEALWWRRLETASLVSKLLF